MRSLFHSMRFSLTSCSGRGRPLVKMPSAPRACDEDDEAALAAQQAEAEAQRRADPFYDSDEEMSSLHAPVINDRLAAKARSMRDGPSDGSRMAFERRGPGAGGDDDEEESQVSTMNRPCAGPS